MKNINKENVIELMDEITDFINSYDLPEEMEKFHKDIIKKIRKLSNFKGKEISTKEFFKNEYYNDADLNNEYIETLANIINSNKEKQMYMIKKFNELIVREEDFRINQICNGIANAVMMKAEYRDDTLHKTLYDIFPWATDSINDFIDLKQLYNYAEQMNYTDTLWQKMIFKETYSLIDRLKTESSLSIMAEKNIFDDNTESRFDIENTLKFRNRWNEKMHNDALFNTHFNLLSNNTPFLTKFEVDVDGEIIFSFDDMEKILNINKNILFLMINSERNGYEHSFPTDFTQNFVESGILKMGETVSNNREKICTYWRVQTQTCMMIFFYVLNKINKLYFKK